MRPAPFQWWAERHAGFTFRYRLFTVDDNGDEVPVDLTGYHVRFMVRCEDDETSPLLATMDTQASPPTITLESSGLPGAVLDVVTGGLPDTLTGLVPDGRHAGDIRMTPPAGDAWYLFRGPFVMETVVTTP